MHAPLSTVAPIWLHQLSCGSSSIRPFLQVLRMLHSTLASTHWDTIPETAVTQGLPASHLRPHAGNQLPCMHNTAPQCCCACQQPCCHGHPGTATEPQHDPDQCCSTTALPTQPYMQVFHHLGQLPSPILLSSPHQLPHKGSPSRHTLPMPPMFFSSTGTVPFRHSVQNMQPIGCSPQRSFGSSAAPWQQMQPPTRHQPDRPGGRGLPGSTPRTARPGDRGPPGSAPRSSNLGSHAQRHLQQQQQPRPGQVSGPGMSGPGRPPLRTPGGLPGRFPRGPTVAPDKEAGVLRTMQPSSRPCSSCRHTHTTVCQHRTCPG